MRNRIAATRARQVSQRIERVEPDASKPAFIVVLVVLLFIFSRLESVLFSLFECLLFSLLESVLMPLREIILIPYTIVLIPALLVPVGLRVVPVMLVVIAEGSGHGRPGITGWFSRFV